MTFGRWNSWLGYSWAYRVFKLHHRELNQQYWAWRPVAAYARATASTHIGDASTSTVFGSLGQDDRRVSSNIAKWGNGFQQFENWVQLAVVMSLSSCLEVYIRAAVRASLESDPGVIIGSPRAVDGLALLKKRGSDYNYTSAAAMCADGTWDTRLGQYRKLFGYVPPKLESLKAELDRIRVLRNRIGHEFGRDSQPASRVSSSGALPGTVTAAHLQKWLGVVEHAATAIDKHLLATHIGEFEALCFYGEVAASLTKGQNTSEATALSAAFFHAVGEAPGKHFCKQVIAYYKKA